MLEELDGTPLQRSFHGNRLKKFVKDEKGWWTPADGQDTVTPEARHYFLKYWDEALQSIQKKVRFDETEEDGVQREGRPCGRLQWGAKTPNTCLFTPKINSFHNGYLPTL